MASGIYFRANLGEGWENIEYEWLPEDERIRVMKGRSVEWLEQLAKQLANTVCELERELGR